MFGRVFLRLAVNLDVVLPFCHQVILLIVVRVVLGNHFSSDDHVLLSRAVPVNHIKFRTFRLRHFHRVSLTILWVLSLRLLVELARLIVKFGFSRVDASPPFFQKQSELLIANQAALRLINMIEQDLDVVKTNLKSHVLNSLAEFVE